MLDAELLNVPGSGWFFAESDAYEPSAGPFRITSIGPGNSASPAVFVAPLGEPRRRRCVPFSRLELRPLLVLA